MSDWLGVTGIVKAVGQRTTDPAERQRYFDRLTDYFKQATISRKSFGVLTFEVTVIDDVANRAEQHAEYASEGQNISLAFNASARDWDIDDASYVLDWLNQYLSDNNTQSQLNLFLVQGTFNLVSGWDMTTYAFADDFVKENQSLQQNWNALTTN